MLKLFKISALIIIMIMAGVYDLSAGVGTVTVKLLGSDGVTGVPNATVKYYKGGAQTLGVTDANGEFSQLISDVNSTTIYLIPTNGGTKTWLNIDPATNPTLVAQMTAVKIDLKTCNGVALAGEAFYYRDGWTSLGNTPVTVDLLPFTGLGPGQGSYDFRMKYDGRTSQTLRQDISENAIVDFTTTKVNFIFSGSIYYYNDGWKSFSGPKEMIGGTQNYGNNNVGRAEFRFGSPTIHQTYIDITGCNVTQSAFAIRLINSAGNGLAGGVTQYYDNSWKDAGTTDANGYVFVNADGSKGNLKFRMKWQGATQEFWQNVSNNSVAVFQTKNVSLKLLSSTNAELVGATKFYSNAWYDFGSGSSTTSMELLPVNHKFRITYNGATLEKWQNVNDDANVIFNTVLVSFTAKTSTDASLSGAAKYYSNAWYDFGGGTTPETLELFPVSHKFRFTLNGATLEKWQNVGDDPNVLFTTVPVTFQLLASDNSTELVGGAKFYSNAWYDFGSGSTTSSMELLPVNHKFRITYKGATQEKWQNVGADGSVIFNTTLVTVRLATPSNQGIDGGLVKYYSNAWNDMGTTGDSDEGETETELLPVNHKFRMSYDGQNNEKWQNVGVDNLVVFVVVNPIVTVKLLDSDGNGLVGGDVMYYSGSWKTFGTTNSNGLVQNGYFLPGNYKWRMTYKGGVEEKWQQIVEADDNTHTITFNTQKVTVELKNSNGDAITDELGTVMYYAGSWKTFGAGALDANGKATEELLPLNYKFRMSYLGGVEEKWQNTAAGNTLVTFATQLVNVDLVNSSNNAITDELGTVMYYAGSWKTFGAGTLDNLGNANMELLPLNYKFRMSYLGGVEEKWQNTAGGNTDVLFQTANVIVKLENCEDGGIAGGATQYYAGSWKTFGTGTTNASGLATMELLPLNYKFRMTFDGRAVEVWHNVGTAGGNVDFEITKVTFASGVAVKYYTNSWKNYTGPYTYLLPGTYKVKFGTIEKNLIIEGCKMGNGIITLLDHTGAGLAGADVSIKPAKGGSWLSTIAATTDANGQVIFNIDPGFTKIVLNYNQGGIEQNLTQLAASNYTWQTALLRVKLVDCNGNYIQEAPGGKVDQGGGTWEHHGWTGSNGYFDVQLFPRDNAYTFRMTLNDRSMTKQTVVSTGTNELLYEAVDVTLDYPGSIVFVPAGAWKTFDKPSMWLLPGNYKFKFEGIVTFIDIEGCEFNKRVAFVKLVNSYNQPIEGAGVEYRYGWEALTPMPNTDESGLSVYLADNTTATVKFTLAYRGTSIEKSQNINSNPLVLFQTVNTTAKLMNSSNVQITDDVSFQYRYGWESRMDIPADGQLLPVSTKFVVYYRGTEIEKSQNLSTNSNVEFNTVNTVVGLFNSSDVEITDDVDLKYRYGWETQMAIPTDGQLLPVSTKFVVYYRGTEIEKSQNLSTNSNVEFNTVNTVVGLFNSSDVEITDDVDLKYRYGWETQMAIPTDGQLLPVSTKFAVFYRGTSVEKSQNLNTNSNVVFNTGNANPFLTGGDGSETFKYRYGWETMMDMPLDGELLPVSTKFSCNYNSKSKEKSATVVASTTTNIEFTWDGANLNKQTIGNMWSGITNYPNPVSDFTTISYSIRESGVVRIYIADINGCIVAELVNEYKESGNYEVEWKTIDNDGVSITSGTYLYVIEAEGNVLSGTMQVVK
jgi:hypothetical protein